MTFFVRLCILLGIISLVFLSITTLGVGTFTLIYSSILLITILSKNYYYSRSLKTTIHDFTHGYLGVFILLSVVLVFWSDIMTASFISSAALVIRWIITGVIIYYSISPIHYTILTFTIVQASIYAYLILLPVIVFCIFNASIEALGTIEDMYIYIHPMANYPDPNDLSGKATKYVPPEKPPKPPKAPEPEPETIDRLVSDKDMRCVPYTIIEKLSLQEGNPDNVIKSGIKHIYESKKNVTFPQEARLTKDEEQVLFDAFQNHTFFKNSTQAQGRLLWVGEGQRRYPIPIEILSFATPPPSIFVGGGYKF